MENEFDGIVKDDRLKPYGWEKGDRLIYERTLYSADGVKRVMVTNIDNGKTATLFSTYITEVNRLVPDPVVKMKHDFSVEGM